MVDLVVTCPKDFFREWIAEGDAAGEPWSGEEWGWYLAGRASLPIGVGDRLYVVSHGRLRGFSPVTRVHWTPDNDGRWTGYICREGGGVAVTIPQPIKGFQSWRYRWWDREDEVPFPNWKTEGVTR